MIPDVVKSTFICKKYIKNLKYNVKKVAMYFSFNFGWYSINFAFVRSALRTGETIDIYYSPIDNIIFNETSSPDLTIHPKILEICMQVVLMVIPHQTRKCVTPLVLFGFKDPTTTLKPHKMKNRKIYHHHSIGRKKTYDYNVTRKQRDNYKKNTGNK